MAWSPFGGYASFEPTVTSAHDRIQKAKDWLCDNFSEIIVWDCPQG